MLSAQDLEQEAADCDRMALRCSEEDRERYVRLAASFRQMAKERKLLEQRHTDLPPVGAGAAAFRESPVEPRA